MIQKGLPVTETFDKQALQLDAGREIERIVGGLRRSVHQMMHLQGAVVGISGGIDSSVVLALCVEAFGPDRTVGVLLPEQESSPESAELAHRLADHYKVSTVTEDISATLAGFDCYRRRDEAVRRVFPEFGPDWKSKIVLQGNLLQGEALNIFNLTVINPAGCEFTKRLPLDAYRQIVAASNFKQRSRMSMLYYHAELRNYAVVGTANKNEHALGFFVKYGDGGADVQPIAHLFKSQVYQLAEYLGVPEEIRRRTPTTDTYSAGSTEVEFFYRVPFEILDLVWLGKERGVPCQQIAAALDLKTDQVERVAADLMRKQRNTAYLRENVLHIEGMTGE